MHKIELIAVFAFKNEFVLSLQICSTLIHNQTINDEKRRNEKKFYCKG